MRIFRTGRKELPWGFSHREREAWAENLVTLARMSKWVILGDRKPTHMKFLDRTSPSNPKLSPAVMSKTLAAHERDSEIAEMKINNIANNIAKKTQEKFNER